MPTDNERENDQCSMSNDQEAAEREFDLTERTACFGECVIRFVRAIKLDSVTEPLVSQLVRSATSVGANYGEADEAGTKKEFRYRISLCKRESKETEHWLRMIAAACPEHAQASRELWKEAHELTLIFGSIYRNSADEK